MTESIGVPEDAELVTCFFAKRVKKAAKGEVNEVQLAERIGEIELDTQILGAAFIKVQIIDPELELTNSGWLEVNDEELIEPIEVEFPEGSGWKWALCRAEISTEVTQPNLELTFESALVSKLREYWGPRTVPPGTQTRAQFVRALLTEADVPMVIHSLNVVQPVEEEEKGEFGKTVVKTSIESQKAGEKVNKTKGVAPGAGITIGGQRVTAQQLSDINTALKVASKHSAPPAAVEALIVAGITESGFKREASENNEAANPHKGIWQSDIIPGNEVAKQAEYFLIGGESFASGGAIERAHKGIPPAKIAVEVEVGGSESRNIEALPEARAIIAAGGGITSSAGIAESDVSQLTRGTSANPDEDSFECINRLATQVDWFAFVYQAPGHPETMFYSDGPDLLRQKPAAYINVAENYIIDTHTGKRTDGVVVQPATAVWDNTTMEYRRTHKVKTRVQRRSKASKPSTPSECRLKLVCGITDYRAGDVFVIQGFGPANKRWIVSDATRNCLKDTFTTFILEPPIEPLPEPKATSQGAELTGTGKTSVAEAAQRALAEQKASHPYKYVPGAGHQAGSKLYGQAPREMDCSAFASLCYQEAGLPVPGQTGATLPATGAMIGAMKKAAKPEPGNLCFFGPSTSATTHVTVYVGNGKAISMGQEGDPEEGPYETTGPSGFLGVWEV